PPPPPLSPLVPRRTYPPLVAAPHPAWKWTVNLPGTTTLTPSAPGPSGLPATLPRQGTGDHASSPLLCWSAPEAQEPQAAGGHGGAAELGGRAAAPAGRQQAEDPAGDHARGEGEGPPGAGEGEGDHGAGQQGAPGV